MKSCGNKEQLNSEFFVEMDASSKFEAEYQMVIDSFMSDNNVNEEVSFRLPFHFL